MQHRNRFRFANPATVTPFPAPLLRLLSGHGKAKLGGLRQPIPPRWPRAFPPSLEHKIPRMCSMARSSGSAITHAQAPFFSGACHVRAAQKYFIPDVILCAAN